jgi:ABC-2 type transport system permease protein
MTTIAATMPRRTPAFQRLLATEAKLLLREPLALFWGIVFPLILTVVFGLASTHHDKKLGGLRLIDAYVPTLMAFVLTVLAIQALPAALATYREKGVLRRMSTTPVSPARLLGADVLVNVAVIVTALVLIAVVARVAFNVTFPRQGLGFVLVLALSVVTAVSLGAIVAALATTTRMATVLGTVLFFPMMFFAGLWVPRQQMGHGLRAVSDYTPLGASVAAIQDTMRGSWPHASHLAVLGAYAIVFALLASRLFRWE